MWSPASSVQNGRPRLSGTGASRWRIAAMRGNRSSSMARNALVRVALALGGAVKDEQSADVHMHGWRLAGEECGIEAA